MKVFLLGILLNFQLPSADTIALKEYYRVFSFGDLSEINRCIKVLDSVNNLPYPSAYKGAMLMKKSLLLRTPESKLNAFKSGHKLLEDAITKSPSNPELRFLRLVIQEHAPEFLKYNINIKEDKKLVIEKYQEIDTLVQAFIFKYSSVSANLKTTDFQ
jgi:hypothetical protein